MRDTHPPLRDCPSRRLLDEIRDSSSMMVLAVLDAGSQRFDRIKRRLERPESKTLTQFGVRSGDGRALEADIRVLSRWS
jgi:DNA-binding HxlR family transcriptional regulator